MPDGKYVYVTHLVPDPGSVSVIDTATNTVVAAISVEGVPAAVAVTPDGKHVYVANGGSNTVSVIETASRRFQPLHDPQHSRRVPRAPLMGGQLLRFQFASDSARGHALGCLPS